MKKSKQLGKLIEANIKRDSKESAKAIAKYVNDEAKGQKLIEEFQTIKEKYGSDEQLSCILKCLSDLIEHQSQQYLLEHKKVLFKKEAFNAFLKEVTHKNTILTNQDYDFTGTDTCNLILTNKVIHDTTIKHEDVYSATTEKVY